MADSNIKEVRIQVKAWLQTQIRIDSWDADPPRELYSIHSTELNLLPANTGIEYPVENLLYFRTGSNSIKGSGTFPYSIVFRYSGELTLDELPLSELESLVQYIQGKALLENPGCSISSVQFEAKNNPLVISREEGDQGDWLAYCNFSFSFEFNVTSLELNPDFEPPVPNPDAPPLVVSDLALKINKAKINFNINSPSDYELDREIHLTNPN
jgi:hypothetical protein